MLLLSVLGLAVAAPRFQIFGGIGVSVDPGADRPVGIFVDTSLRALPDARLRYGPEVGTHVQLRMPGLRTVDPWMLLSVGGGGYTPYTFGYTPWFTVSAHAGIGFAGGEWAWRAGGAVEKNISATFIPGDRTTWSGIEIFALQVQAGVLGRFDPVSSTRPVGEAWVRAHGPASQDY